MILKNKILFNNILDRWLTYKKISIKESTYYRYEYIINKYIAPYFTKKSIKYLENYDFNEYINFLLENDLSVKTVSDIVIVLKSILNYTQELYNVHYNLKIISIPKKRKKEIDILDEKEEKKLEYFCLKNQTSKHIGIILSLNTGLRLGELCFLKWENINLKERKIFIKGTVQRIYKGKKNTDILIDEPKTISSIRTIPINNKLLDILKKLKKNKNDSNYFLTGNNKIMEPRCYYSFYKRILNKCNIKNYSFHTLRHTFATKCIKIGMDPKSLSEVLGHADVNITLNSYVHSSDNLKKKYLNKL